MHTECGETFDILRGECLCCPHLPECFERDEDTLKPKRRDSASEYEELFAEIVACVCATFVAVCVAALIVYGLYMQLKGAGI